MTSLGQWAIATHGIAGDWNPAPIIPTPEPPAYPLPLFTIDLCVAWKRVGEALAAEFDGIIRNLEPGEWQLTGAIAGLRFQQGYDITKVDTIRVVRNDQIVYSGVVAPVSSGQGGLTITDSPDGERFELTGADPWTFLASRVAYPTPSTSAPWADSWDVRTGKASTVAAAYLAANLGVNAISVRQVPMVVLDDLVGTSATWSARLQPLSDLIARVCADGGITCRLGVDFNGTVTARLSAPADRHTSIVVSDEAGLVDIEKVRQQAQATYVIAGGQGQLTARVFGTAGSGTGYQRREVFTDQTSLSTAAEVTRSAARVLAESQTALVVRAQLTDWAAAGLRYLVDYDIGDTISVEIDGVRYSVPVQAITVHVSPERSKISPVLGAAVPDLVTGLLDDVADLQDRFDTQIA